MACIGAGWRLQPGLGVSGVLLHLRIRLLSLSRDEAVEIGKAADDAAAQEADQQHEHDTQHQLPGCAEAQCGLQEVLKEQPNGCADQRSEQRAPAADGRLHHELARGVEGEGVGRHEGLEHAEQSAGEARVSGCDHEGGQLVAMDVVADGRGAQRIVADRTQNRADRRAHDPEGDDNADEIAQRDELIERPAIGEVDGDEAEIEARRRHAGQAVFAAGEIGKWIEFDEEEHFRDCHGDHREIDAGAAQCDQADQVAGRCGRDHADDQRAQHVAEARAGQQVGGDEAAGAVEGGLAEREQAGEAEQDVEAEPEQAPDQDPVHGVRREPEMRQHEGGCDQADRSQGFDQEGALLEHQVIAYSRPWTPSRPCGRTTSTSVIAANSIT
ncbi:hypothetical protein ACVWZ6_000531 [Bradyrhizobium sp. GM6.1]